MHTMKNEMTFDEFTENLPRIDWYYMMAEGDAYYRGRDTVAYYRSIAQENGPEWVEAFEAMQKSKRIR